ncbi:hypothetical protein V6N13_110551 [Hibiscus sabdariffa]
MAANSSNGEHQSPSNPSHFPSPLRFSKFFSGTTLAMCKKICISVLLTVNSVLTEDIKFIQELFARLRSPATSTESKKFLIIVDIGGEIENISMEEAY